MLVWVNLISHLDQCSAFLNSLPLPRHSPQHSYQREPLKTWLVMSLVHSESSIAPTSLWVKDMVVCKALNSLNPSFSPFLLPHYPLATLGVLLFLRKARPSPAPGSLHLCFLCLEHDLLRYPHSSPFSSFRSIFTCHLCREPSLTPLFKTEYKCPFQFLLYYQGTLYF